MLTKQEKIRNREQNIISEACALINEEGFFNLWMSDIASKAGISVGTLYTHFESREDLVVGIALHICTMRDEVFSEIAKKYKNDVDLIASIILINYTIHKKLGEVAEVETLAIFPSIWKRASYRKMDEVGRLVEGLAVTVRSMILQALSEGDLVLPRDIDEQFPNSLGVATWGLPNGINQVLNSYYMKHKVGMSVADEEMIYFESIEALLKGFGSQRQDIRERCQELLPELHELVENHINF